jgi:hypothetical protein
MSIEQYPSAIQAILDELIRIRKAVETTAKPPAHLDSKREKPAPVTRPKESK